MTEEEAGRDIDYVRNVIQVRGRASVEETFGLEKIFGSGSSVRQ